MFAAMQAKALHNPLKFQYFVFLNFVFLYFFSFLYFCRGTVKADKLLKHLIDVFYRFSFTLFKLFQMSCMTNINADKVQFINLISKTGLTRIYGKYKNVRSQISCGAILAIISQITPPPSCVTTLFRVNLFCPQPAFF